jgi:ubiquinone/menaquinone biosynthesis C-methylase UbiE
METDEKLKIRIHAHTAYTSIKLEDWLSDWLGDAAGCRLLEIGCGNGNYFTSYAKALGKKGQIIGFDINCDLLEKALEAGRQLTTPTMVFPWDYDTHPYPIRDKDIDIVLAPFSAYYTNNVPEWIDDTLRVIKNDGRLLLLGPTKDNARELYELNELATGISTTPETDETSAKLEELFYPELEKRPEIHVKISILAREIVFPTAEEYTKYYFATWLYEKTTERLKEPIDPETVLKAAQKTSLKLNKKIICLEARKK